MFFLTVIGLCIFLKNIILGKELKISFITAQRYTPKDLSYNGGLNVYEWFVIRCDEQRENLLKEGYLIPNIDFRKNYLIVSRYKISKSYIKPRYNSCQYIMEGQVIFDKINSNENFYYFYTMSTIELSQGIG